MQQGLVISWLQKFCFDGIAACFVVHKALEDYINSIPLFGGTTLTLAKTRCIVSPEIFKDRLLL